MKVNFTNKLVLFFLALCFALCSCRSIPDAPGIDEGFNDSLPEFLNGKTPDAEEAFCLEKLKNEFPEAKKAASRLEDLFIRGKYASRGKNSSRPLVPLEKENPLYYFNEVERLAYAAFGDNEAAKNEFYEFPHYGDKNVEEVKGITYAKAGFFDEFPFEFNENNTVVIEINRKSAALCANIFGLNVNFSMKADEKGIYRFERGIYFLYRDAEREREREFSLETSPDFMTGMKTGSAKTLTGKFTVLNLFLSDAESEWTGADVNRVFGMIFESLDFIQNGAKMYKADLDLSFTDKENSLYLKTDERIQTGFDKENSLREVFEKNKNDIDSFIRKNTDKADNYCILVHLNKSGRSYAAAAETDSGNEKDYTAKNIEYAVVYGGENKNYKYAAVGATYAHELFHLCGADDLYGEYISEENEVKAEKICPTDIMRKIEEDINLCGICPYTAFKIGWEKRLDPFYASFADNGLHGFINREK